MLSSNITEYSISLEMYKSHPHIWVQINIWNKIWIKIKVSKETIYVTIFDKVQKQEKIIIRGSCLCGKEKDKETQKKG